MKLSNYFIPFLKETPKDAQIVSHRLMLRAGMIQQDSVGVYSWLPLGKKVLDKIIKIVTEEQIKAGSIEILMPTIQSADLWKESGRYDDYGKEMLRIEDRHNRSMIYGPTNEEIVTDIFRKNVKSYKSLPINLFQIQWKFRDEVRPRFVVMRGREFLMKDGYSFDFSEEKARYSYNKMFLSYLAIFQRIGLVAIPMEADTGPIGGNLSHEFIILAKTGESEVFFHKDWLNTELINKKIDYNGDLQTKVDNLTSIYAATDEKHDPKRSYDNLIKSRGIEVGHIFYFGTKYSLPMKAEVLYSDGKQYPVHMGSYGIGISRLVGAIIEANYDDNGIIWPKEVSPFEVCLLNLSVGNKENDAFAEEIYDKLLKLKLDVLYDDIKDNAGVKFERINLLGIPHQIIVGSRLTKNRQIELKLRKTNESKIFSLEEIINFFTGI